jgi:glycosyltransferase involved in cell wall biosynthesis
MKIRYIQSDYTACAYYRILVPYAHLLRSGLADVSVHTLSDAAYWEHGEDLTVIPRQYLPIAFRAIQAKRKNRIAIVGELDDDIESTPTGNPAYSAYSPAKIREEEEKKRLAGEIAPDQHLLNARKWLYTFFRCCDAVTVPTPVLQARLRKHNKRVYVLPNYINDLILPKPSPPPPPQRRVRILWTGSNSHIIDMPQVFQALQRILTEYDNVVYVHVGEKMPGMEALPESRVEYYPPTQWCRAHTGPDQYLRFLSKLPVHIAIAPLQDNRFNQAKSWLKAIEYGAMGYFPMLQDMAPYQALRHAGMPDSAYFVKKNTEAHWYTALKEVLEDPQQVYEKAKVFQTWVWDTMRMSQHVQEYLDVYERVLDGPRNTWFPPVVPEELPRKSEEGQHAHSCPGQ